MEEDQKTAQIKTVTANGGIALKTVEPETLTTITEHPSTQNDADTKNGQEVPKKTKKEVKWPDSESEPPSRASSTTGSPGSYRNFHYQPIPSQSSSVASSAAPSAAPSAASSAFASRNTSTTNLLELEDTSERDRELEEELARLELRSQADTVVDNAGNDEETASPAPGPTLTSHADVSDAGAAVQTPPAPDADAARTLEKTDAAANDDPPAYGVNTVSGSLEDTDTEEMFDVEIHDDSDAGPVVVGIENTNDGQDKIEDPWESLSYFAASDKRKWSELTTPGKCKRVWRDWIGKPLAVLFFLYFFIVALALMGDAFTLIGGSAAGAALSESSILENAMVGLMVGMLVTVLLQSSSATTSIIVSMVAANIIDVPEAIPMVMGANLGTSVTNTIVAGGQAGDRDIFRRSFAGATVHDCFNWLAVFVLLPIEVLTGYLYHLTSAIVDSSNLQQIAGSDRIKITDPVVELIIQLDMEVLERVALGITEPGEESLVKRWCVTEEYYYNETVYDENGTLYNYTEVHNYTEYIERCNFLFAYCDLADQIIGVILLVLSLVLLMCCLIGVVKVLTSMLRGSAASSTKKFLNASFPGYLSWLTGYIAILLGCLFTMLLQSSSVFTSLLTPLVGMGMIKLERMYPLTLGANLGTTFTSLIAAFASSDSVDFVEGVQISLCHMFFNLTAIILYYPIPITRRPAIKAATYFGNITAEYRWFSLAYIFGVFFILPIVVLVLAIAAGWQWLALVSIIAGAIVALVILMNLLQSKCSRCLPAKLRTWEFLPAFMRSLKPYDSLITKSIHGCKLCKAGCRRKCTCCGRCGGEVLNEDGDEILGDMHTVESYVSFRVDPSNGFSDTQIKAEEDTGLEMSVQAEAETVSSASGDKDNSVAPGNNRDDITMT